MRRITIGSAIVLALLLMLTAIAASAAPDGFCEDGRVHPRCPTTTTSPTIPEPPALQPCEDQFTVTGGREQVVFECDWILPDEAPDAVVDGVVTVHLDEGEVSGLVVMVRDSSPGDFCDLYWPEKPSRGSEWYDGPLTGDLELTFPLNDDRGTYWDFDYLDNSGVLQSSTGAHWCGPYDPIDGLRNDLNGDPLHLRVFFDGNKNKNKETAIVSVTLSPVQEVTS
jgi:hypothetical protein